MTSLIRVLETETSADERIGTRRAAEVPPRSGLEGSACIAHRFAAAIEVWLLHLAGTRGE